MAASQMSEVLQHLRRTVFLRDGAGLTDGQLLTDYLGRRDEASLEALVRRHGPMVWGVCRRALRNYHDAEDAFQATFLVLVRKAASIRPRQMVGNWLYGVAHQTALKARATSAKRQARERQVADMPEPAVAGQDLSPDLQPLLDVELSRLPDKYRAVLLLCDLEGLTRQEAARRLGCPEGTVAGRLARARVMLAKRLAQRGVVLSGVGLAAALSQNAASAGVRTSVVFSTVKAASLIAAGQAAAAGVIPTHVAALAEGVLKSMLLQNLKMTIAVLMLAVVVAGSAAGLLAHARGAGKAAESDVPAAEPDKNDEKAAEPEQRKEARKLKGKWRAVAAEVSGNVLPEKTAKTNVWEIDDGKITTRIPADVAGIKGGKAEEVLPFKIDPSQKPAHIDIEGEVAGVRTITKGIYKLDGDELTVCLFGANGGRPTEFTSSDLSGGQKGGMILYKFKREKQEKDKEQKE